MLAVDNLVVYNAWVNTNATLNQTWLPRAARFLAASDSATLRFEASSGTEGCAVGLDKFHVKRVGRTSDAHRIHNYKRDDAMPAETHGTPRAPCHGAADGVATCEERAAALVACTQDKVSLEGARAVVAATHPDVCGVCSSSAATAAAAAASDADDDDDDDAAAAASGCAAEPDGFVASDGCTLTLDPSFTWDATMDPGAMAYDVADGGKVDVDADWSEVQRHLAQHTLHPAGFNVTYV